MAASAFDAFKNSTSSETVQILEADIQRVLQEIAKNKAFADQMLIEGDPARAQTFLSTAANYDTVLEMLKLVSRHDK
jgi:hypothetical protein